MNAEAIDVEQDVAFSTFRSRTLMDHGIEGIGKNHNMMSVARPDCEEAVSRERGTMVWKMAGHVVATLPPESKFARYQHTLGARQC